MTLNNLKSFFLTDLSAPYGEIPSTTDLLSPFGQKISATDLLSPSSQKNRRISPIEFVSPLR